MNCRKTFWDHVSGVGLAGILLSAGCIYAAPVAAQDSTPPADEPAEQPAPDEEAQAEPEQSEAELAAQAEAAAQARAAAQAALASELASAKRFEAELDALLLPDGQLDTTQQAAKTKLNSVATRCGILANSASHDQVKLVLLGYQARALAALASIESAGQDLDRMEQLNDVAQQIVAIDLPGAAASSDYWLLVAEMTRLSASAQSPAKRLAAIEQALRTFIEKHEEEPEAAEFLLDTRLSLAQLMDQRGAQHAALKQLNKVGKLPEDSPRHEEAKRLRESIARLGVKIEFESISTQLLDWRSLDHLGKPVLIHVYSDAVEPSVRMIDVISRRIVSGTLSGIAVVSLRVGDPVAGSNAPPWPTLPVQLERDGVLDQLGVSALPTLAWLDRDGQLASIGTTAAVLDQVDTLAAEPEPEPAFAPGAERDEQPQDALESESAEPAQTPADEAGVEAENSEN